MPRLVGWMFSIGLMALGVGVANGQDFPNKPIRIVTSPPGGGADFASRVIAQGLTNSVGWQVIVENRPGNLTGEIVSRAPPDGYTLVLTGANTWLLPFFQEKMSYDVARDLAPVTLAQTSAQLLVVHPSLPVKSVKELIALAKARPGELNYAGSTAGSSGHLAAELFKAMTGTNMVRIPYKGAAPAVADLMAGHVQLTFGVASGLAPHIKSGRLRALAVTTARPFAMFAELPTVAATVPGYEMASLQGIFAPGKTPATIINRLNQELVRVLNRADVKEQFLNSGTEATGTSPEQFGAMVNYQMTRLGKVIKDAGIREE